MRSDRPTPGVDYSVHALWFGAGVGISYWLSLENFVVVHSYKQKKYEAFDKLIEYTNCWIIYLNIIVIIIVIDTILIRNVILIITISFIIIVVYISNFNY
jgi:hypothetical protein